MTGSANNHEGNQTNNEDMPKPITRSKMKKLVSRILDRLRKNRQRRIDKYVYLKVSYVQYERESEALAVNFLGCRREIDRSNDIRLRANKDGECPWIDIGTYKLLWIIGMRRAWYVTFIQSSEQSVCPCGTVPGAFGILSLNIPRHLQLHF